MVSLIAKIGLRQLSYTDIELPGDLYETHTSLASLMSAFSIFYIISKSNLREGHTI